MVRRWFGEGEGEGAEILSIETEPDESVTLLPELLSLDDKVVDVEEEEEEEDVVILEVEVVGGGGDGGWGTRTELSSWRAKSRRRVPPRGNSTVAKGWNAREVT